MLNAIINNPFRIIGVYTNTPLKECVSNINKIKAYASIGKQFESKVDMPNYLPVCSRDVESVEKAIASIKQDEDKISHAFFWFCNITSLDNMALENLASGNIERAEKVLSHSRATYSGLINSAVLAFMEDKCSWAVNYILQVIHDDDFRNDFIKSICGETFSISEKRLSELFLDVVSKELDLRKFIDGFGDEYQDDANYLIDKEVNSSIQRILEEANKAKNADESPRAQLSAGKELMESTKDDLNFLHTYAKGDNLIRANSAIDNLAERILQCGINYYNDSTEAGAAKRALPLQKYAMEIAVGKRVKDRCTKNYNIIKSNAEAEAPAKVSNQASQIETLFKTYNNRDGISAALELLGKCAPILSVIKEEVGYSNKYYRRISSRIMRYVQSMVISAVNESLNAIDNKYGYEKSRAIDHAKDVIRDAWKATLGMAKLEIEDEDKADFNKNKTKLSQILSQAGISTYSITSPISIVTETESFNSCKSIVDYNYYIKRYPNGKYVAAAKAKIAEIKRKQEEEDRALLSRISSTDDLDTLIGLKRQCVRTNVLNALDDKCFLLCHSKKDYRKYDVTFGTNARHHSEVEKKLSWDRWSENTSNWLSEHKGIIITIILLLAIGGGLWFLWGPTPFAWIFGIIAFLGFGMFGDKDGDGSSNGIGCLVMVIAGALCFLFISLGEQREKDEQEDKDYQEIVESGTVENCKDFIRNYPNSSRTDEIVNKLFNLENNNLLDIQEFSEDYNLSTTISEKIKARVQEISDSLYNEAESTNTENAWRYFTATVPEQYLKDGKEKLEEIENLSWSTEPKAWEQAKSMNTTAGYEKYLSLYPKGAHKKQADKFLIDSEVNNIYAGSHGDLPPMEQTSGGGGSSSYVSISNDTEYTLSILYSGPSSTRLTIPPHGTRSATLSNGTYRVAASAVDGSVGSFAGNESLSGGSYSARYYIITY